MFSGFSSKTLSITNNNFCINFILWTILLCLSFDFIFSKSLSKNEIISSIPNMVFSPISSIVFSKEIIF